MPSDSREGTNVTLFPPAELAHTSRPDCGPTSKNAGTKTLFSHAGLSLLLAASVSLPALLFSQERSADEFSESKAIPFFQQVDPAIAHFRTFLRRDLDGAHSLVVVHGSRRPQRSTKRMWLDRGDAVGVFVGSHAETEALWKVALVVGDGDNSLDIECVDRDSITFSRTDSDYGFVADWIKIYFDVKQRRVLREFEIRPLGVGRIAPAGHVLFASVASQVYPREQVLAAVLTPENPLLPEVITKEDLPAAFAEPLADDLEDYPFDLEPLPQSSLNDLADARFGGRSVKLEIQEDMGPTQIAGNRLWFGKTFYDGEGITGVGGFGYFDPVYRKYVLFSPPEIRDWSVSALLVEDDVVWLGRYRRPEGAEKSGGLLRYEIESGSVRVLDVGEVIRQIEPWGGRIYLAPAGGLSVVDTDEEVVRFVFTPSPEGETAAFPCEP